MPGNERAQAELDEHAVKHELEGKVPGTAIPDVRDHRPVKLAVGKVEGESSPGAGDVVHRDRGLLPDSPDRANGGEHQRDAASDEEEVSHPERARVGGCVVAHRDALGGYRGHGQSRVVKTVRCLTHGRTPADFRADLAHRRATEQPLPLCEPASMRRAW